MKVALAVYEMSHLSFFFFFFFLILEETLGRLADHNIYPLRDHTIYSFNISNNRDTLEYIQREEFRRKNYYDNPERSRSTFRSN